MTLPVYFADLRVQAGSNLADKIVQLIDRTGLPSTAQAGALVAVKVHFGETGNTAFVRPVFLRTIIERLAQAGCRPFLTDTNTLYRGARMEAVSHLGVALAHGFSFATVQAPVIIADGLRGNDAVTIAIEGSHFREVQVAAAVAQSDCLVCVSHVKGHELTGFGGALKNVGMGCASRAGKLQQHSTISPQIDEASCVMCEKCRQWCPVDAIVASKKNSLIITHNCVGCAECISICPQGAIHVNWNECTLPFQEKMVEYACGVLKNMHNNALYLNFLMNISPACDCYGFADRSIVPDIGILASRDPVAIDQASADLVSAEQGILYSALTTNHSKGLDKWRGIYPQVDWEHQLDCAQQMGIGRRDYNLVKI